ncbi:hypothetical protein Pcac1_g19069 [Phytophthora cactorum]|nr:hypothetical protein Pcac1_g19069 [Phytophthora cactorum]
MTRGCAVFGSEWVVSGLGCGQLQARKVGDEGGHAGCWPEGRGGGSATTTRKES